MQKKFNYLLHYSKIWLYYFICISKLWNIWYIQVMIIKYISITLPPKLRNKTWHFQYIYPCSFMLLKSKTDITTFYSNRYFFLVFLFPYFIFNNFCSMFKCSSCKYHRDSPQISENLCILMSFNRKIDSI